jgi:murein DD-endopeptidase MepM/ murein hydrolase activator NlpD
MSKLLAALLVLGLAASNAGAQDCEQFTRQLGTGGVVYGTLADTMAAAGVPVRAMDEAARALGTAIDLAHDVRDGDHFYVRWEQAFTLHNRPTGKGRLLWVELRTKAKGTITVQRFRAGDGKEQFFLAGGKAAAVPQVRLPLDAITITSGYGLRHDPLDQPVIVVPPPPTAASVPEPAETDQPAPLLPEDAKEVRHAFAGFHPGEQSITSGFDDPRSTQLDGIMARRRAQARAEEARKAEQEAEAAKEAAAPPKPKPVPPPPRPLFMHTGLDLLANTGTPVHAAADGLVVGARPNGLYGNWIRIDHPGKLATVYGHLSAFAPGIEAGTVVARGDVIGFVGNTGRSTGAHLHFELLADGHPVNPANHPAMRPRQLAGRDLERLRKKLAASLRERELEQEAEETVALSLGAPLHPL